MACATSSFPVPVAPVIKTLASVGASRLTRPITLGQHNDEVYAELLGLSQAQIDAYRESGVI